MFTRLLRWWPAVVAIVLSVAISGRFDRPSGVFSVTVSGAGRPVILVPGLATPGAVWDDVVERWRDRHELHVLTLAGFGGPEPVGEPFLPRVARGVVDYVRERGLQSPVIVGHSLGATVAFMAASLAPDVFGGIVAVDGVPFLPALSDPAATPGSLQAEATSIRERYADLTREQFLEQNRRALAAMISDDAARRRARDWAAQASPEAVGIAMAEMLTTDLRGQVGAITSPVLLIGALGAAPAPARPSLQAAYDAQVAAVPHARTAFATGARHFVMLDDPDWFFATTEPFLAAAAATEEH